MFDHVNVSTRLSSYPLYALLSDRVYKRRSVDLVDSHARGAGDTPPESYNYTSNDGCLGIFWGTTNYTP